MAEPTIKARLELVSGGISGGSISGSSPIKRVSAEKEEKANQSLITYLPLISKYVGITSAVGVGGLIAAQVLQEGFNKKEDAIETVETVGEVVNLYKDLEDKLESQGTSIEEQVEIAQRYAKAMEEMEEQGMSTAGGFKVLADGSIILFNDLGKVVEGFGGGMANTQTQVAETESVFKALNIEANALVKSMVEAQKSLSNQVQGVVFRGGQGFSSAFGPSFSSGGVPDVFTKNPITQMGLQNK